MKIKTTNKKYTFDKKSIKKSMSSALRQNDRKLFIENIRLLEKR